MVLSDVRNLTECDKQFIRRCIEFFSVAVNGTVRCSNEQHHIN